VPSVDPEGSTRTSDTTPRAHDSSLKNRSRGPMFRSSLRAGIHMEIVGLASASNGPGKGGCCGGCPSIVLFQSKESMTHYIMARMIRVPAQRPVWTDMPLLLVLPPEINCPRRKRPMGSYPGPEPSSETRASGGYSSESLGGRFRLVVPHKVTRPRESGSASN
jgi:hypothetical protein